MDEDTHRKVHKVGSFWDGVFGNKGGPSKGNVRSGGEVFDNRSENVGHSRGREIFTAEGSNGGSFDGKYVKVKGTNVLEIESDGTVRSMQGRYLGKVRTGDSAQDKAAAALLLLR